MDQSFGVSFPLRSGHGKNAVSVRFAYNGLQLGYSHGILFLSGRITTCNLHPLKKIVKFWISGILSGRNFGRNFLSLYFRP
jgi:hypothetical protein